MLHSNSPIDTSSYTTGTNVFNNQSKYHSFFTKLLFLAAEDVTKYWQSWHFRVVHRVSAQHLSTWFSFTSKKILFRGFRWNFRVTFNILRFYSILGIHAARINKINSFSAISYLFSFLLDCPMREGALLFRNPPWSSLLFFILLFYPPWLTSLRFHVNVQTPSPLPSAVFLLVLLHSSVSVSCLIRRTLWSDQVLSISPITICSQFNYLLN